jgi:hypothetical protein
MIKNYWSFVFIFTLLISITYSQKIDHNYFQKNGEVYFSFEIKDRIQINDISKIISIDNLKKDFVFAYANEKEFKNFLKLEIPYFVLPHPGDVPNVAMSSSVEGLEDWDAYPTYDAYVAMMYQFQNDFPGLCRIVDAGNSINGRDILFAVISDSVNLREVEPQFMYSSSMHGDEITGYVLMLRLIDYLLNNYNSDDRITYLVDNIEIWINPLANPDGTYYSGNNTVSGARRYNANFVDLNRNFPDPAAGPHPDGNEWQAENLIMMNLAETNHFVMSANFHGGTEVVNYPWDTWAALHPDDNWYKFISREYADTVHLHAPSNYMNGYDNGITNGYAWYQVEGGRQDYFTYFHGCRETTIEISDTKIIPGSQLPAHWEYNYRSFLNYIEQSLNGISGIVTSSLGYPLKAQVHVGGHDFNNSQIYSDSITGGYTRMIYAGTYDVTFSADSHYAKTIYNVPVQNNSATVLNVELEPNFIIPVELVSFTANVSENNVILNWSTATETNNSGFQVQRCTEEKNWFAISFVEGMGNSAKPNEYKLVDKNLTPGKYGYRLKQIDYDGSFEFSKTIEAEIHPPIEFSLKQNYPNPFNPNTTIEFSLPHSSYVDLKIFDALGNEVQTFLNNQFEAGKHIYEFNASKLSSGIYFYRLAAGEYSQIRKLILLK